MKKNPHPFITEVGVYQEDESPQVPRLAACRRVGFDPGTLPDGQAISDQPDAPTMACICREGGEITLPFVQEMRKLVGRGDGRSDDPAVVRLTKGDRICYLCVNASARKYCLSYNQPPEVKA